MRAAVTPAVNGRWEVRDVPRPQPGPNEALIRITASGLCFTDVHITHGMIPTQFPRRVTSIRSGGDDFTDARASANKSSEVFVIPS